ncbi:LysE/ArgO family amino acid transporter [Marmoricola sp. RAF53]|uniref:LysE/ArgO family amino acid transporter n=1 Tax=Marmoricola sp. RAF53 TaxID=3233059 RepID=UPI003F99D60E
MTDSAVAGFLTGLTLIVAIGAQNAYVLRQGLARSYVGPVVAVCAVSDVVLVLAGVAGIGTLVARAGWVIDVVRWFGVAFLVGYAVASLRRALRPESLGPAATGPGATESRRSVVLRAVALTWLNPHVYLDTVLLLGSIATAHAAAQDVAGAQWWFAAGACLASIAWFSGLGYGARLLAPLLTSTRAWQVLELLVAATMLLVAVRLAVG